jgi:hypothetical protein
MTKEFSSLSTIISLHNSPESLKIKKDQGLDAWCVYTIYLAYIRKYKGLTKSSDEYRYFLHDIKTATRMTDDRLLAVEKYLIESDVLFVVGNTIQHSELYNYLDQLGEVKRKAVQVRWAKAEAREPKEQNKADETPVNSNLYQRLNKIKIDGQHSIFERDLLAITRAFPEDTLNYFIDNLPAFKKAAANIKAKIPFCLGEWKLIDHLKKHWENKLELKKELPAWVNAPIITNPIPAGNYNQPQPITNDPNMPDFSGKYKRIFSHKTPAAYSWQEFTSVLISVLDRQGTLKPTYESKWFMSIHSPEEWMKLFDKWFFVENTANISEVKKQTLKKLVTLDNLKLIESDTAIAERMASEVINNG